MYQILSLLLQPYLLLVVGSGVLLACAWRRHKEIRRSLLAPLGLWVLLYLCSTPLAGFLGLASLEWSYSPSAESPTRADAIVVLSGSLQVEDDRGEKVRLSSDTLYRCLHAAQLYRLAGGCSIVVTGGKVDPSSSGPTLAKAMGDFLIELGVRPADVVQEEQSRTTFENARNTKGLLENRQPARVFLVTDAAHMKRASKCFQAQGIPVVPAPCNHRTPGFEFSLAALLPSVDGIDGLDQAFHEWLGLAWYWLRGRI